ncbi:conjugative transfer protein MobI(A/C) [Shewanella aestuarii]|uniref:Uncharacterized protein n=1 Tax=Shewanella aestuarii TaxID=1028752 RepID=A0A6G9QPM9_9GAMM|nr:conjugative transfer protein MobI(A/C) [Shewanella aestuarii]QIR16432.1 hypothetical protein HBH39_18340 [Shewanella aestuarii]
MIGSSSHHDYTTIEMLDEHINQLKEAKEKLHAEAAIMVDAYWNEWKEENKRIHNLRQIKGSDDYVNTGRLAPRIYSPSNTQRVYIEWWDYRKHPLRNKIKSFGKRIKPNKNGYTWACVAKNANVWEKKYFLKYEQHLDRMRVSINLICDQINSLHKVKRLTEKKIKLEIENTNSMSEEYNNG